MKGLFQCCLRATAAGAVLLGGFGIGVAADEQTPAKAGEQAGVEGTFVRVAENQEGWVVIGYRVANESVGKEWVMLDIGMTVQRGVKDQKITRDQIKLVTPDKKVIPLATQQEVQKARNDLAAMVARANMMDDSINYFPAGVTKPCRIGFFSDPAQTMRGLAFDQVDLNSLSACVGKVFFHVPGGIQLGNYNVDVVFKDSIVRVPMDIMTKDQAKEFEKKWKEEKK